MKAKLIAFPYGKDMPYLQCFYADFNAQGVEVLEGDWSGRWLMANVQPRDIVHLHWPSYLYETDGSNARILKYFLRFLMMLCIARMKTRNLWWTAHNLMPHEPCRIPGLDWIARVAVIGLSSRVFVHGEEAKKILLERFPIASGKVAVIPHGNWIGFYPPCESSDCARRNLKIPIDAFVYLHFGNCRPYKNIEGLIEAFGKVARQSGHPYHCRAISRECVSGKDHEFDRGRRAHST